MKVHDMEGRRTHQDAMIGRHIHVSVVDRMLKRCVCRRVDADGGPGEDEGEDEKDEDKDEDVAD